MRASGLIFEQVDYSEIMFKNRICVLFTLRVSVRFFFLDTQLLLSDFPNQGYYYLLYSTWNKKYPQFIR